MLQVKLLYIDTFSMHLKNWRRFVELLYTWKGELCWNTNK